MLRKTEIRLKGNHYNPKSRLAPKSNPKISPNMNNLERPKSFKIEGI